MSIFGSSKSEKKAAQAAREQSRRRDREQSLSELRKAEKAQRDFEARARRQPDPRGDSYLLRQHDRDVRIARANYNASR